MATYEATKAISRIAGADLSASIYLLGIFNSSGQVIVNTTAQGPVDCVIAENVPAGYSCPCVVADGCVAKVKAGAAITNGALVASSTAGKVIAWVDAAGNIAIGRAVQAAAADNEIIEVHFIQKRTGAGT